MQSIRLCIEKPLPHEETHIKAIESASNSPDHRESLQAAFYTSKLWDSKTKEITVQLIDPKNSGDYLVGGRVYNSWEPPKWTNKTMLMKSGKQVDPLEDVLYGKDPKEAVVKVIMERIQPLVPFKIKFVNSKGNVKISFAGGAGSWSLIGTDHLYAKPNEATLNYGWLDVPTIIHEFCHTLGMIHEHQNPRGNTIQWDKKVVYAWAKESQGWDEQTTFENIIKRYEVGQVNGSDYDPNSIMLYFFDAKLTLNHVGTQQNPSMSFTDIKWIKQTYPGSTVGAANFYSRMKTGGNMDGFNLFSTNILGMPIYIILLLISILLLIYYIIYPKIIENRFNFGYKFKKY